MARRSGRAPAAWQTGTCLGHHATALVRETQRDSCYADCAWVSPAPTAPGHQSPCACPCGRSPARLARRSEPGSSPAPDLRQRADHDLHDRSIARSNDPHPHATAELNLNRFRGRSRAWLRDNRHRREPRRGTLSATELLPPSEQLADVNASGSRYFRGHCARLQRSSNDPLFLGNRPSTPALHRRDHLDLRLAHRTIPRISPMTCDSASNWQCGLHRTRTARAIDWGFLEQMFGAVYTDKPGQPPLPTRLMAGLAILKHTYDLSDEALCDRWVENPYFQYF